MTSNRPSYFSSKKKDDDLDHQHDEKYQNKFLNRREMRKIKAKMMASLNVNVDSYTITADEMNTKIKS